MYADVKKLFEKLNSECGKEIQFSPQDTRIAAAVLLFRVILVDGRVRDSELTRFREILQDHMNVEPDELALFEKVVRERIKNGTSLYSEAHNIERMPLETKQEILRFMKDISISDNELHEFEINLVVRTAEILKLPVN